METDFLTAKQQLFCDEYLVDRNAYRAALRAGYSASTALNGQLMQLPKIKLYIQQQTAATSQKAQVGREEVLAELCKIAFGNMGNYYSADGNLKPMSDLTADEQAAVWQCKTTTDGTASVKMYNKLVAVEKIAKILNLYAPEVKAPEKEVVYVDTETATADDYFDDEELKAKNEVFIDEYGGHLYGDGFLPYGPLSNVFQFRVTEAPQIMINRLRYFEDMRERMKTADTNLIYTGDFKNDLNNWLDSELLKHDCVIAGDGYDDMMQKMEAFRVFKRKVDLRMVG